MDAAPRDPADARWPTDPSMDAPAPSDDFVDATLDRILGDPDVRLSVLLAAYRVPTPSADFVTRTLARLASVSVASPAPLALASARRRPVLLAAAAVLLVAAGLWFGRGPTTRTPAPGYRSFAAALGEHAVRYPHRDAPPLDGFFAAVSFAGSDGLLLIAGGQR